ncbi:MAG: hypothetical protein ACREFB_08655 [Stellaceae bacterium]
MRLLRTGAVALGLSLTLAACAGNMIDPHDAARRAAAGAVWGAALGTAVGATFAINPGIGAPIGAMTGATLGAASGLMTAQPAVTYAPIRTPSAAVVPGFYDSWAPGSHPPPVGVSTPPPAGAG